MENNNITLTEEEFNKINNIVLKYNNLTEKRRKYQNTYNEKHREELNKYYSTLMKNKYHSDPEYRKKKIATMNAYNKKKRAEKNNELLKA